MALTGSSKWLSISFYQTKLTDKGSSSSHLPGREGKEIEAQSPALLYHRKRCMQKKLWRRGRWVCTRVTYSAHCSCSHSVHPSRLHPRKLTHTDTDTHIFFDWKAVLVILLLARCMFSVFGNRHQSTWRLIINSPDQGWSISGSVELLLKLRLPGLAVVSLEGVGMNPKWDESRRTSRRSGRSRINSTSLLEVELIISVHVSLGTLLSR